MMNSIGERWQIAGNVHLLKHFRTTLSQAPRRYGTPASYGAMKFGSRDSGPRSDASAEWIANVNRIVAAKNTWVAEMTDIAMNNGGLVPSEFQKQIWDDLIGRAEAAVAVSQAA